MEEKKSKLEVCFSEYPRSIILGRLFLLILIFSSGIFVFYQLKIELSYLYIFYSLLSISLILPLSRCVHCTYHGKYCNIGWGKVAGFLFPRKEEDNFTSGYDYMLFIYPIWFLPLLASLLQLSRFRNLFWLAFSCIYIILLLIEKVYLKNLCCKFCSQKKTCPGVPLNSKKIR
ncbi:MAG: hypothetical protein OEV55_06495 [candidate division Zixibacteria bacterium]|nr:hypothetical protein [candidate division Zixibacteria bacterium]